MKFSPIFVSLKQPCILDKTKHFHWVAADGNCLYHACSTAVAGNDKLSSLLRALTSAELYLYPEFYASHPTFIHLTKQINRPLESVFSCSLIFEAVDIIKKDLQNYSECVRFEALKNSGNKRWCSFICMLAVSSVLGLKIHSFYPDTGAMNLGKVAFNLSNAIIEPRHPTNLAQPPICLL